MYIYAVMYRIYFCKCDFLCLICYRLKWIKLFNYAKRIRAAWWFSSCVPWVLRFLLSYPKFFHLHLTGLRRTMFTSRCIKALPTLLLPTVFQSGETTDTHIALKCLPTLGIVTLSNSGQCDKGFLTDIIKSFTFLNVKN